MLSANPIPGNEEAVHLTVNNLDRLGAHTYRGSAHGLHASGHAAREELRLMLTLCRPRYFMPVHGEYRHLAAHRELAIGSGVPAARASPWTTGRWWRSTATASTSSTRGCPPATSTSTG